MGGKNECSLYGNRKVVGISGAASRPAEALPGTGAVSAAERVMTLVGWESIRAAMDNVSRDTLRRWTRNEGFPLGFVGHTPLTTEALLKEWVEGVVRQEKDLQGIQGMPEPSAHTESDSDFKSKL